MANYKRALIKLSGEALAGDNGFGIDTESVNNVIRQIKEVTEKGIEVGREKGYEEGREEGRESALVETARNLLDVLSDEIIAQKIGLPLEQVKELRLQNQ